MRQLCFVWPGFHYSSVSFIKGNAWHPRKLTKRAEVTFSRRWGVVGIWVKCLIFHCSNYISLCLWLRFTQRSGISNVLALSSWENVILPSLSAMEMQLTGKIWIVVVLVVVGVVPMGIDFTTAATEIRKHFRIEVTIATHSCREYIDLRSEGPSSGHVIIDFLCWPRK